MNNEEYSYGRYDHFDDFDEVTIYDTYQKGYVNSTFYYPTVVDQNGKHKSDPVYKVNVSQNACKWSWQRAKADLVLSLMYKINRNRFRVERH